MKILCISDQLINSNHSAIEAIFGKFLKNYATVSVAYFDKNIKKAAVLESNKIMLPYYTKKRNIIAAINQVSKLDFDYIIVRNFYSVLSQILNERNIFNGAKIGFWESFPHDYRRVYEAELTSKSVIRKKLEFLIKSYLHKNLISKCDFFLGISYELKKTFYDKIDIPFLDMPMGVDFDYITNLDISKSPNDDIVKFVYVGAIDKLREFNTVASGFTDSKTMFELHIYSQSNNTSLEYIKNLQDNRIFIHSPKQRQALFKELLQYDVGVGLIPETLLYTVSSPTKTFEYSALGLAPLVNYLPEYKRIYNTGNALFCEFDKGSIAKKIEEISKMPKKDIALIGINSKNSIFEARNYKTLSIKLVDFLRGLK